MPEEVLLAFVGVGAMALSVLSTLALRVTLTRRLKQKLKPTGDYWKTGTLDFGFLNTYLFAWACVLPYMQRSDMFQNLYPGLDIKAYANWFERWAAYGTIGGLLVACLCAIVEIFISY